MLDSRFPLRSTPAEIDKGFLVAAAIIRTKTAAVILDGFIHAVLQIVVNLNRGGLSQTVRS